MSVALAASGVTVRLGRATIVRDASLALNAGELAWVQDHFQNNVLPVLTPLAIDRHVGRRRR